MKILHIFLFFLLHFNSLAEEESSQGAQIHSRDSNEENPILELPEVKKAMEDCQNSSEPMSTCVWTKLSPEEKEKIYSLQEKKDGSEGRYESLRNVEIKRTKSPAEEILEKYLFDRLSESLSGDKKELLKKGMIKVTDQRYYFELYRTQQGKAIVGSLSSYCLDANKSNHYLIYKDEKKRRETRKLNLEMLQNSIQGEQITIQEDENQWQSCMRRIQYICYGSKDSENPSIDYQSFSDDEDYIYSSDRACMVNNNIRALKQSILATDKILEVFDQDSGLIEGHFSNVKKYSGGQNDDEKSVNELTSISSSELVDKSGFSKGLDDEVKKFQEECFENSEIIDSEKCKDYLATNSDEAEGLLLKEKIKYEAIGEKIKKIESEDEIKKYYEDMGYKNAEKVVKEELKNFNGDINKLRESLVKSYEKEKEALIKKLKEDIESQTATFTQNKKEKSKIETSEDNVKKLENIEKTLKTKANDMRELTHYNNVISSYLTIGNEKKSEANLLPLKLELAGLIDQEKDKKQTESLSSDDIDRAQISSDSVKEFMKKRNLDESEINEKDKSDAVTLDVEEKVNPILLKTPTYD